MPPSCLAHRRATGNGCGQTAQELVHEGVEFDGHRSCPEPPRIPRSRSLVDSMWTLGWVTSPGLGRRILPRRCILVVHTPSSRRPPEGGTQGALACPQAYAGSLSLGSHSRSDLVSRSLGFVAHRGARALTSLGAGFGFALLALPRYVQSASRSGYVVVDYEKMSAERSLWKACSPPNASHGHCDHNAAKSELGMRSPMPQHRHPRAHSGRWQFRNCLMYAMVNGVIPCTFGEAKRRNHACAGNVLVDQKAPAVPWNAHACRCVRAYLCCMDCDVARRWVEE